MATYEDVQKLKAGAKISFKPGGRGANTPINGEFVRIEHPFVVTKDGDGKERKVRHGGITIL